MVFVEYDVSEKRENNHRAKNNVSSKQLILSTLIMEAICSYEASVVTRETWRHIPEEGIVHSHLLENLKCYSVLFRWVQLYNK
jgi:hypothetical protein